MKLPRSFYERDTRRVARALIGMYLCRIDRSGRRLVGRIVETEAYRGPRDRASHAFRGRTLRTNPMFGPPGHAYIYLIYGMYHCLNVVTESEGFPAAVLVRAVEPVEGIRAKTSGPGLLCRAMAIDLRLNRTDLCNDESGAELYIEAPPMGRRIRIGKSARVGVDYAGHCAGWLWRFFDRDSVCVSRRPKGASGARIGRILKKNP